MTGFPAGLDVVDGRKRCRLSRFPVWVQAQQLSKSDGQHSAALLEISRL